MGMRGTGEIPLYALNPDLALWQVAEFEGERERLEKWRVEKVLCA